MAAGALLTAAGPMLAQNTLKGHRIEDYTWPEAEAILRPDTVVVIPLGAAAKEHGRHLKLRNDLTIAEYFTRRVLDASHVAVAPALTYHFYPAFVEYPGSTSLSIETARNLTVEVVRSLARSGPRRFYVVNTGVSTNFPLQQAAKVLASDGILLQFTDFGARSDAAARAFREQPDGSHADEIETSLMLHIAPAAVDMTKAVREIGSRANPFRLTRRRDGQGTYSESGVWGDATVATARKGAILAEALTAAILDDIEQLRGATPPEPSAQHPAPAAPPRPPQEAPSKPGECNAGDLRRIMQIGPAYTFHWANADAERLAGLWGPQGDVVHPDGNIERLREVIFANRAELFGRREYRNSKHPLTLTMVRCINYDVAVADGRWSMTGVKDAAGRELPIFEGQATLVVKRSGDAWSIEAYRYTLKPPAQPMPVWLKRPGWPDK
jgi:creatinine amidohydrolase